MTRQFMADDPLLAEQPVAQPVDQSPGEFDRLGLVDNLIYLNRLIFNTLQSDSVNSLLNTDLTMSQLKIIMMLGTEGVLTVGQISEKLGVGGPTTSYQLDKVVQAELADRFEDGIDRRRNLVKLTPQGVELFNNIVHGSIDIYREMVLRLDPADLAALWQGTKALAALSGPARAEMPGDNPPSQGN